MRIALKSILAWAAMGCASILGQSIEASPPERIVFRCDDFEVNGHGDSPQWKRTEWNALTRSPDANHDYKSRFKVLYSSNGLYVLLDGTDRLLTSTMQEDFAELWKEDVYEFFLWPDERMSLYFEYEISPLGYELPIIVPNIDGKFLGWKPWVYGGDRKIKKAVTISGGSQASGSRIMGWKAEVFVPYELLRPLGNVPPKSGTRWRANFYRLDYDDDATSRWCWARISGGFHDYKNFGTLIFE